MKGNTDKETAPEIAAEHGEEDGGHDDQEQLPPEQLQSHTVLLYIYIDCIQHELANILLRSFSSTMLT